MRMVFASVSLLLTLIVSVSASAENSVSGEVSNHAPSVKRLTAETLAGSVFDASQTEALTEKSEAGEVAALDRVWHESDDRCLQTGVYETGINRYTIDEPYPYDELMMFIDGGVTLSSSDGEITTVTAGDTVLVPKGWTGLWDSTGYRKVYVIYNCPD